MAISNDYSLITSTGTIEAQTQNVFDEVVAEYKGVFGSDLVTTPDTPQGVLITAETTARTNVLRNNSQVSNQMNPNLAGGVFLDAICALTGLYRAVQTYSQIQVLLTGIPGTVIPTSAQAADASGNVYQNTAIVTLATDGTATATFQAINPGPILTPPNSGWSIVNPTLGWETISNSAASTLGSATQSDFSLKIQRRRTLGLQGLALPIAIKSALYGLDSSVNLSFLENDTSNPIIDQGINLVAHSIYVCVSDLGYVQSQGLNPYISDIEIATIILGKKSAGGGFNNTSLLIQTGNTTNTSQTVGGLSDTSSLLPNMFVTGTGIPANTTISTIVNSTTITISNPATATGSPTLSFANPLILSGTLNSSITITGISNTALLAVGMKIFGANIPTGATVASIVNTTTITISAAATASGPTTLSFLTSSGTSTNARSIPVTDPTTGFNYTVLFDRPVLIPILIKVTISQATAPSSAQAIIQAAIQSYINGQLNQEPGFGVGNAVSCFELAGAVNQTNPSIYVINVQTTLASNPTAFSNNPIYIAPNEQAILSGSVIVVTQ